MRRQTWAVCGLMLAGCGQAEPEQASGGRQPPEPAALGDRSTVHGELAGDDGLRGLTPPARPAANLNQPFEAATTLAAPDGSQPPPDVTAAGKSAAALALELRKAWPTVALTDQPVTLAMDTDAGPIEITLDPTAAPNHVRNFLALAKVGYYDGLVFERTVTRVVVPAGGSPTVEPLRFVTAGCPLADGSPGRGHLGYFLKPEPTSAPHAEGTVGFWREEDERSDGVRFYITLGPAPLMDGKYTTVGQVTKGLEAVRAIADAPTREPELDVPVKPVTIRKVSVK